MLLNRNSSDLLRSDSSEQKPRRKQTTKKGRGYTPTGLDHSISRQRSYMRRAPQSIMKLFRDHSAEAATLYSKEQHLEKPALEAFHLEPKEKDDIKKSLLRRVSLRKGFNLVSNKCNVTISECSGELRKQKQQRPSQLESESNQQHPEPAGCCSLPAEPPSCIEARIGHCHFRQDRRTDYSCTLAVLCRVQRKAKHAGLPEPGHQWHRK